VRFLKVRAMKILGVLRFVLKGKNAEGIYLPI